VIDLEKSTLVTNQDTQISIVFITDTVQCRMKIHISIISL